MWHDGVVDAGAVVVHRQTRQAHPAVADMQAVGDAVECGCAVAVGGIDGQHKGCPRRIVARALHHCAAVVDDGHRRALAVADILVVAPLFGIVEAFGGVDLQPRPLAFERAEVSYAAAQVVAAVGDDGVAL